jgi:hypothetical protein
LVLTLPYKNLKSLMKKTNEQIVKDWIAGLNEGSKNYAVYMLPLIEWGRPLKHWDSAEDMLNCWKRLLRGKNEDARNKFVKILHDYVETKKFTEKKKEKEGAGKKKDTKEERKSTGAVDRKNCWAAMCNFFTHFKLPLPALTSEEEGRLFRIAEVDKQMAQFIPRMTPEETRIIIENAPMPYRAILTVMLQSGMGGAEFETFNQSAWQQIAPDLLSLERQLHKPGPVKFQLYRSKTSQTKIQQYYTFLGGDAKTQTLQWLKRRPDSNLSSIFVVRQKGPKKHGDYSPVTASLIEKMMTDLAKRLGLLSPQELKLQRYHIRPHRLRKVFKGICDAHHVVDWASEFFIGHNIGPYRELPWTDPEQVRKEYLKAEPGLNILTGMAAVRSKQEMMRIAQTEFKRLLLSEKFSEDEIAKMNLETKTMDEIRRMARQGEPSTNGGQQVGEQRKQRIVEMSEVAKLLDGGWEFVQKLSDKQVIVRSPPSA